jgi:hypothetical protein
VPVLLEAVETADEDLERYRFMGGLRTIRGGPTYERWNQKTPLDYQPFLAEYKAWWEKNKDRSRVEWLLENLEAGGGVEPYFLNPLLYLGEDALKDMPADLPKPELRKETVRRLREWVKKTGFTFNKDTPRVPYQKPVASPR